MIQVIELQVGKEFIAIKDIPKMIADAIIPNAFPYSDFEEPHKDLCAKFGDNFIFTEGANHHPVVQLTKIQKKHLTLQTKYQRKLEKLIRNHKLVPINHEHYSDKYSYPNYNDLQEDPENPTKFVYIFGDITAQELVKQLNSLGLIVLIRDKLSSSSDDGAEYKRQEELINNAKMAKAGTSTKRKKGHHHILRNEHFKTLMEAGKLPSPSVSLNKTILSILREDDEQNKREDNKFLWGKRGQSTFDKWLQTTDAKELMDVWRSQNMNK